MEYVPTTRKSVFPLLMALRSVHNYDVIHTHDAAGGVFALRSRLHRLPLVSEFHAPRVHPEGFWKAGWRWRHIGLAARNAPFILTPSRWLAGELQARYGIDQRRIHILPNGIGDHWFDVIRNSDRSAPRPPRVVLVNMKEVAVGLHAFARLSPNHGARLELYGLDKDREEHIRLARELGIADRVTFCGFVPNEELPKRLVGADLLLYPTRADNFPQVLQEASALGIPALTSPIGGIPEIVIDGETGVHCNDLAAFTRAMEHLISNPIARNRMAHAARKRAQTWRWKSLICQMEDLYSVVRKHRSPG
jgi:glycosyltransferase involved in cell wall biosynthesis